MAMSKKQVISIIVAAILAVVAAALGYIFGVQVTIEEPEVVIEEVGEVEEVSEADVEEAEVAEEE